MSDQQRPNENELTSGRRERITSVAKNKISNSKTKLRKERDKTLRDAYKELLAQPHKKVADAGKAWDKKNKEYQKIDGDAMKKTIAVNKAAAKKEDEASRDFEKKYKALMAEKTKKFKAILKEQMTKNAVIAKAVRPKEEKLKREMAKLSEKIEKEGYKLDVTEKKLVRPQFRTDEKGRRMLGGALAKPLREFYEEKFDLLDENADEIELALQLDGTSAESKVKTIMEDVKAIVEAVEL